MPESIRNAIVVAFIAVLVAMVGVGLLLWRGRPAAPPARSEHGLPLLVTDQNGGIYDLNVKVQQMERRLGESQVIDQQLLEALKSSNAERDRIAGRLTVLEKEVRSLRNRVRDNEQRESPRQPAVRPSAAQPAPPAVPAAGSTAPAASSGVTDSTPPPP